VVSTKNAEAQDVRRKEFRGLSLRQTWLQSIVYGERRCRKTGYKILVAVEEITWTQKQELILGTHCYDSQKCQLASY
jgi:hypothetical protein